MDKKNTTKKATTGNASEAVIDGAAELAAQEQALKEQIRAKKEQAKLEAWEKKTKQRNAAFVLGSTRPATEKDAEAVGHLHGKSVCEIKCQHEGCGTIRIVNKQDAFQVRFCQEHKKMASKARAKAKRESASKSPEAIQARIAELQAQLAKVEAA